MIVTDAIDLLRNSELKQVAIKDDKPGIIGFINLAVLEIYKRFNLWEAEAIITMATDVLLYKLDGIDTNVAIDLSDNQLLMIEVVYDELGIEMVLNDEKDPYSISTPQYHQIEIQEAVDGQTMGVIYRAAPKFLTNEKAEIPIPPQFLEALFHYVGFKGHGGIKAEGAGSNTYYKLFENSLKLIKEDGLFAQDDLNSHKFEDNIYP